MPQCAIIDKNAARFTFLLLTLVGCSKEPDQKSSPLDEPEFRIEIISRVEVKIILLNENRDAEYSIFRSVNEGPASILQTLRSGETTFSDNELNPDNTYNYYIDGSLEGVHKLSKTQRLIYREDAYGYTTEMMSTTWEYASKGRAKISADGKTTFLTRGESLSEVDFYSWNESGIGLNLKLNEHPGALGLACSPDTKWIAVGSLGTGSVTVLDNKYNIKQVLDVDIPGIYALEFSPTGDQLYVGGNSNSIQIFSYLVGGWTASGSFESGSESFSIQHDRSHDELLIATSSDVRIQNVDGTPVQNFQGLSGSPGAAIFSYDAMSVLAAGKDAMELIKWNRNTAEIEHKTTTNALVTGIAVTPHKTILTGDSSGKIILLDEDLNIMKTFAFSAAICDIAYHADLDYAVIYLIGGRWALFKNRSSWEVE